MEPENQPLEKMILKTIIFRLHGNFFFFCGALIGNCVLKDHGIPATSILLRTIFSQHLWCS